MKFDFDYLFIRQLRIEMNVPQHNTTQNNSDVTEETTHLVGNFEMFA